MTTVACTRYAMASDSRVADDNTACQAVKMYRTPYGIVGVAGSMSAAMAFVAWLKDQTVTPPDMTDVEALLLTPKGEILCYDESLTPFKIKDRFSAIGSGAAAALGALHAGVSPTQAVRIAAKIDCGTGGRVRTMRL